MRALNFSTIFQNAFDTFKVFETIPVELSGVFIEGHSKTIWQTLNHLILWRAFQIDQLKKSEKKIEFNEPESWISESKPKNSIEWHRKIAEFKSQTTKFEDIINNLAMSDVKLSEKLKLIQDSSTHLAFHLGEIIVIARQKNAYPKPSEMNEFLKD